MSETIDALRRIRNTICKLEIRGYENSLYIAYSVQECDRLIAALTKAVESQNGVGEDVSANAESHTG